MLVAAATVIGSVAGVGSLLLHLRRNTHTSSESNKINARLEAEVARARASLAEKASVDPATVLPFPHRADA